MGHIGGRRLVVNKARGHEVKTEGADRELLSWYKRKKAELESADAM